jgi:outer membrane lipoprotein SlyB
MRYLSFIILILPLFANAQYQRNVARQVDRVDFAVVENVRYISQPEVAQAKSNGLETFVGALTGGIIGSHFGGGNGRPLAIIVGSVAGASIAHNATKDTHLESRNYRVDDQLVDLLLKQKDGSFLDVVQDVDSSMLFKSGDKVRILYFGHNVRVDKVY